MDLYGWHGGTSVDTRTLSLAATVLALGHIQATFKLPEEHTMTPTFP